MDFFEHQDLARKKTAWLVVLFAIAIVAIFAALYFTAVFAVPAAEFFIRSEIDSPGPKPELVFELWNPIALYAALGVSVALIGGGTLYKTTQLSGGGRVIAEELGGTLLTRDNADASANRLLNVVEEMAIASGTPVPPVYLLEREPNVNAFAAGFRPEDAVIGVTRGAVELLSREQLQGVIAHEFSHVLSGDMRLNIRLVAVLHGILVLGITGLALLRIAWYGAYVGSSRRDNRGFLLFLAVGAALAAIGFIGVFFGNWIKSSVSRQREYLADASAVQFTRNPEGIAGALKVVGGLSGGAKLRSPNAPEASHMFFGKALVEGMFATHPPLADRIRRIDPSWNGKFARVEPFHQQRASAKRWSKNSPLSALAEPTAVAVGGAIAASPPMTAPGLVNAAGRLNDESVQRAQHLIKQIPADVGEAAGEPFGARAVILALLIHPSTDGKRKQAAVVTEDDPGLARLIHRLAPSVLSLPSDLRMPVLERAMQPLAQLSLGQVRQFRKLVDAFVLADNRTTLFEWITKRLVGRRLDAAEGLAAPPRVNYYALIQLGDECSVLLSVMARVGAKDEAAARAAFVAGAAALAKVDVSYRTRVGWNDLDAALGKLETVAPKLKRALLQGCGVVLMHDHELTTSELELFRAVSACLGVPMPALAGGPQRG